MHRLERKDSKFSGKVGAACRLGIKSLSEDGEFEGYASTFGNVDRGGDVAVKGCFMGSLRMRPPAQVKMLWQHDTHEIVGKWLEMREDERGLYVKGKVFTTLEKGAEAYLLMKEGQLDGLSIGFRSLKDEWDNVNGVRRLLEVDLREVSLVTFPMNELAAVQLVKAGEMPTEREFEGWLTRDAGFSQRQAKTIISSGFKALKTERDAGMGEGGDLKSAVAELAQILRNT